MAELCCPSCDAQAVVAIIYGEPPTEPSATGGCIVSPDSSRWACTKCRHRWGVASRYDFGNLAGLLETAIGTAMWSLEARDQFEAFDALHGALTEPGFMLVDDAAEQSRVTIAVALDGEDVAKRLEALTSDEREKLATALLHLLRFAERKASNG